MAAILGIIQAIPALISVFKEVMAIFVMLSDNAKIQDFKNALIKARTTKDTRDLEKLFSGL